MSAFIGFSLFTETEFYKKNYLLQKKKPITLKTKLHVLKIVSIRYIL